MPPECKEYDCKNEVYYFCTVNYAPLVWNGDKWMPLRDIEVKFIGNMDNIDELTGTMNHLIKKYNSVHRDSIMSFREFKSCKSSDSTS